MFRHEALPNPAADIRLLKIGVDDDGDELQCGLTTFPRSEAPNYVALSYVWGLEEATSTIELNGQVFEVRPNLKQCLDRLQGHGWDYHYWIDAICIDQENFEERSFQVRAMSGIYKSAIFVVAWLGQDIGELHRSSWHAIDFLKSERKRWEALYEGTSQACSDMSASIADLCNRAYWRRLWVIQEIALAQEVRILCGANVLPWQQLEKFFSFINSRQESRKDDFKSLSEDMPSEEYEPAVDAFNRQEAPQEAILQSDAARFRDYATEDDESSEPCDGGRTPKLVKLIARHHGYTSCRDPRDKVYGLLALDADCEEFVPDYNPACTVFHAYVDIMLYLYSRHPGMPALYVSQIIQRALLVQSHERPVFDALEQDMHAAAMINARLTDLAKTISTVDRVGAFIRRRCDTSLKSLDIIRESLDLEWTDEERSFCRRDFTAAQQSALKLLIDREDMFVLTSFNLFPGSKGTLCSSEATHYLTEDLFVAEDTSGVHDFEYRFFVTDDRLVGLACSDVRPGDTIFSAYGGHAPLLIARKPTGDASHFRLIGRCYLFLLTDDEEKQAAKETADIDYLHLNSEGVSDTYWAPQVTNMQPSYGQPSPEDRTYTLSMNVRAMLGMSALSAYWIDAANRSWYNESLGKPFKDEKSGTLGRIRLRAVAQTGRESDEGEEDKEEKEDEQGDSLLVSSRIEKGVQNLALALQCGMAGRNDD